MDRKLRRNPDVDCGESGLLAKNKKQTGELDEESNEGNKRKAGFQNKTGNTKHGRSKRKKMRHLPPLYSRR